MKRRDFIKAGAIGVGTVTSTGVAAGAPTGKRARANANVSIIEADVASLQAAMASGRLTAQQLTSQYLARMDAIDHAGPHINAVIERNPDALTIAAALDAERRAKGPRGPLHGIPVLIKDNIATADRMQTTAGSLALVGAKAPRDAFVVQRLRAAGAVILGKTNLSEWANIRSTRSTSGWSARGGQTRNPYALDRNTSGSSSGSGAAIAASLATLAIGTETDGSIVSPSSLCGLVGLKPTVGLVSRDGIIPISHSQDTAGPMTRTVTDAAVLLNAIVGIDSHDAATATSAGRTQDYLQALDADGLRGARIGVVRNAMSANLRLQTYVDAALVVLRAKGATLIDVELPNMSKYGDSELEVLLYELKADLNKYLAEFAPGAPVRNLKEVIAFNEQHRGPEMPYFDQELFIKAEAKGDLDSKEYREALANGHRYSRAEGIDQIMAEHKLDALFAPTGGPAWLTDYLNGDHSGESFSAPAAVAGYPHITVPAGFVCGLPVGISFVAGPYAEAMLLRLAFAFEQATHHRRAPTYAAHAAIGLSL